jgi:ABC-type lipoprotein export system ATPase subunit
LGFFDKLKDGLKKTKEAIFGQVSQIFRVFTKVDEEMLEELEELLIMADTGVAATEEIIDRLRERIKDERITEGAAAQEALKEILVDMIGQREPLLLDNTPAVILVIGVNGVGKTTLIKTLLRKIPARKVSFNFHIATKVAYLEQELNFDPSLENAMHYFNHVFPRANIKEQRAELSKVGLKGELATKLIKNMSGGEQVRAKLAILNNTPSNVLILDEPTNHLDVRAKASLKEALIKYEGAIILVSHEQDFAKDICNIIFDAKSK